MTTIYILIGAVVALLGLGVMLKLRDDSPDIPDDNSIIHGIGDWYYNDIQPADPRQPPLPPLQL